MPVKVPGFSLAPGVMFVLDIRYEAIVHKEAACSWAWGTVVERRAGWPGYPNLAATTRIRRTSKSSAGCGWAACGNWPAGPLEVRLGTACSGRRRRTWKVPSDVMPDGPTEATGGSLYIVHRLFRAIVVLLLVTMIIFVLLRAIPGNVAPRNSPTGAQTELASLEWYGI